MALRRRKGKGDSFSDFIKKHFGRGLTGKELGRLLDQLELEDETLDALDELIEGRREQPARAADL